MASHTEHYIEASDGLKLIYREFGESNGGLPILCLAGLTRNSRDFEDVCARLGERYRVLALDLRGRGFSDWDPNWRNYNPQTYADDVLGMLDVLQIDQVILLGTSLGGLISTVLSYNHPNRVAGVMLNDVGPEVAPEGLERIKGYVGLLGPVTNWDEAAEQAKLINSIAWPDLPDEDWHRVARRLYREDAAGVPRLDMDPMIGEAARKVGATLTDPWVLFEGLIDIPAMVLHGETSDILTMDIVERMLEKKPDLEHVLVPGVGHVPLLDEPVAEQAIDAFLEKVHTHA